MSLYKVILDKYIGYYEWGKESGYNLRYLIPLIFVLVLDFRKKMGLNQSLPYNKMNVFRNTVIFAFWMCLIAPTLTGQSSVRAIAFFLPGMCFYLPYLLQFYNLKIKLVSIFLLIATFIFISSKNPGWILPYHSIFSDYKMSYSEFIYRVNINQG